MDKLPVNHLPESINVSSDIKPLSNSTKSSSASFLSGHRLTVQNDSHAPSSVGMSDSIKDLNEPRTAKVRGTLSIHKVGPLPASKEVKNTSLLLIGATNSEEAHAAIETINKELKDPNIQPEEIILLASKITSLEAVIANDPLSRANLHDTINFRYEQASKAISLFQGFKNLNSEAVVNINKELHQYNKLATGKGGLDAETLIASAKLVEEHMVDLFATHAKFNTQEEKAQLIKELKQLYKENTIKALSSGDVPNSWQPLEKKIYVSNSNGTAITMNTTHVTTASAGVKFNKGTTEEKTIKIAGYPPKGGVASVDRSADHAVNLNYRSYTDASGKPVCGWVRHGVNGVQNVSDKSVRAEINLTRARETAAFIVMNDTELLKQIMIDNKGKNSENPLKLNIWSVNLQTSFSPIKQAAKLAAKLGIKVPGNDAPMIKDQLDSWAALADENSGQNYITLEITGPDNKPVTKKIFIEPKISAFNFGVNEFAVGLGVIGRVFGWGAADKTNRKALEDLMGEAAIKDGKIQQLTFADFIKANPESPLAEQYKVMDPLQKDQADALFEQIVQIHNSKSFKTGSIDPYKMGARLILLGEVLNNKVAFNCKSGKDRTSQADSEALFLKQCWMSTGAFPKPDEALKSEELLGLYKQFIFNAGNFEIQKSNTGSGGYKLSGVPGVFKRGLSEQAQSVKTAVKNYARRQKGASGLTKS